MSKTMLQSRPSGLSCVVALLTFSLSLLPGPALAADGENRSGEPDVKKELPLPLKPERNVEFTTDQGTWLSLDVSPDGKSIVFELVGDLYTMPFSGGDAHKITSGMAFSSQPRFSPDGKRIAFLSDRGGSENVWISNVDGSQAKQLSQDEQSEFASPVWTPDGNYVIASRFTQFPIGAAELWMYHVKGGAGVQIKETVSIVEHEAATSDLPPLRPNRNTPNGPGGFGGFASPAAATQPATGELEVTVRVTVKCSY